MSILDSYNKLMTSNVIPYSSVATHIPTPNDLDYKRGYIARYFTQKVNDSSSPIYEINAHTFTRLQNNPMFVSVSIKWRDRKSVV